MKFIVLLYLLFSLLLQAAQTQSLEHQSGTQTLLASHSHPSEINILSFQVAFEDVFEQTPHALYSTSGFEGLNERGTALIDLTSKKVTTAYGSFEVKLQGVSLIQVSYFFFNREAAAELGLFFWDSADPSPMISRQAFGLDFLERGFRKQPDQDYSLLQSESQLRVGLTGGQVKLVSVMSMPKRLSFLGGVTTTEVIPIVQSGVGAMKVSVDVVLPAGYQVVDVPYFLLLQFKMAERTALRFYLQSAVVAESSELALSKVEKVEKQGLPRGQKESLSDRQKAILSRKGRQLAERVEKTAVLVGVVKMQGKCSSKRRMLVLQKETVLDVQFETDCSESGIINTLWLQTKGRGGLEGRLLSSDSGGTVNCISGTMANYYNWTELLTVTKDSSIKATEPAVVCVPCPIGCLTCSNVTGIDIKCWNAYCLSCSSSYNIALRTDSTCGNMQYCTCKNPTKYPNSATQGCSSCSTVIPNCQTCKASEWAGTYCAQCASGYYPTTAGNMPRSCSPCGTACLTCTSGTMCTKCAATFTLSSGLCICLSSSNLYYNSATGTCTSCSTAIPFCTACSAPTATSTTCTSCQAGTYLSGGTACLTCSTYCTSCTATTCTSCLDSSFTPSGPNCLCHSTSEMYLDFATSTCLSCATIIPGCLDCSGTNSTSITCNTCAVGDFFDGTACSPCTPYCDICSNSSSCSNCSATFTYTAANGTCNCDATNNLLLDPSGTTCISCSDMVSGCTACTVGPLVCTACSNPLYLDAFGTCSQCPAACLSCSDTGGGVIDCFSSCVTGYSSSDCSVCVDCSSCVDPNCAVCATPSVCTGCEVGFFYDSGGTNLCVSCSPGCVTCSGLANCSSCLLPFIASGPNCVCNALIESFFDGASCSSCSSVIPGCSVCSSADGLTTTCSSCSTGSFLLNTTYCQTCPSNSTACTSAAVSTACQPTFALVGGHCLCDALNQKFLDVFSGTCQACSDLLPDCLSCAANSSLATLVECVACADGFYINANYNCSACPATCLTCTPAACVDCLPGYNIINATCSCDAALQMFDAGTSCLPCYSFVALCTECTGFGPLNVTCLSCPQGTYMGAGNLSCTACPANCDSCDSLGCTVCVPGFTQTGGACVFLDTCGSFSGMDPNCLDCATLNTTDNVTGTTTTENVCQSCQMGTFLASSTSCVSCPPSCATCSSFFDCLTCQPTYSLVNGACACDPYSQEVEVSGACIVCSSLIPGCLTCNSSAAPVQCATALPTFALAGGVPVACPSGCSACFVNGSCSGCVDGYSLDASNMSCSTVYNCSSSQYFSTGNLSCEACDTHCLTCSSGSVCLTCNSSFSLINSKCACDTNQGLFLAAETGLCEQCGTFNSTANGLYTANCHVCAYSPNASLSFDCAQCSQGYFLTNGQCSPCQTGCSKCTSASSCYQCESSYLYSAGLCVCDTAANYFSNGTGCELCTIAHCVICTSLTHCSVCETGYFLDSLAVCQAMVCGDGIVDGYEECDDGNVVDGDGCSSVCLVELYFLCSNPSPGNFNSSCYYDTGRFKIEHRSQSSSCNRISFTFQLTGTQSFAHCSFKNFLKSSNISASYLSYAASGDFLTYHYQLTQDLQLQWVSFLFDPYTLCVRDSYNFNQTTLNVRVDPDNNYPALYYPLGVCEKQQRLDSLVSTVEYTSYATLLLSALPCKIVGLQLFGVLQLSYLSLGSMDDVNVMLAPLKKMNGVNGYSMDIGADKKSRLLQVFTPERINSIDYNANFIRNVNVMLIVVGAIIGIALLLYLCTYCCKNCAPALHRIAKRVLKEVLLTLILFNILNFSYSAGIHFKYAPTEDSLYGVGTFVAVLTLVLAVLMAVGLEVAEEEGFGEYKDKMKRGCLEKAYFVITIVYRMGVGLYLSTANEDDLSTLIVLAISIMFLIYNLVNLPFTEAYHNYRANICHLTQFVTLFVAMYYRSMMSNKSIDESAYTYGPVYLEYGCIVLSLIVSVVVLAYEIYLFIKKCCCSADEKLKSDETSCPKNVEGKDNRINETIENMEKDEHVDFEKKLYIEDLS